MSGPPNPFVSFAATGPFGGRPQPQVSNSKGMRRFVAANYIQLRRIPQGAMEDDILVQLSYSAAKAFVSTYYADLHNAREKLSGYYTPTASISWNGNQLTGGADVQKLHTQMMPATYEVQCFDAQPLLPNGRGQCSVMLATNGYVKFGEEKDAPLRGFSETLVLEPDTSTTPIQFLVTQQSFRFVF
ncbi:hypothetical protein Dda_3272 [Drechslerella dactyloides]|uniref:NTF2 domain-containing protein n=1 Tax=Drechslerella dactyloides TaxID=74499 RepID=A0AAD6NL32_DREDA|nr:hypothetical protein Dda_3272 [Drechslerella dactyloides]